MNVYTITDPQGVSRDLAISSDDISTPQGIATCQDKTLSGPGHCATLAAREVARRGA